MPRAKHNAPRRVKHFSYRVPLICDPPARNMSAVNLRAIRKREGLSQAQLAELVGVDQTTISRAERLEPNVTLDVFIRCATALDTTLAHIFGPERSEQEEALIRTYRELRQGKQIQAWETLLRQVLNDEVLEHEENDKAVDPSAA